MTTHPTRRALAALPLIPALAEAAPLSSPEDTRLTLERYATAWLKGDRATLSELYADDIVFNYLGSHGLTGRHEGKARAQAVLGEFNRRTSRRLKSITDIMVGPTFGALVVREAMGPAAHELTRILVYTVSGGLLRSCTIYDENQSVIDRLVGPTPF